MGSITVEDFEGVQVLSGLNYNQIRDILQGFLYDIVDVIGGQRE